MLQRLVDGYYRATLQHPLLTILVVLALLAAAVYQAQHFRLDASSDSLVLENDDDLLYYREVRAQYGSDEFLIVTYTPHGELFSDESLTTLQALRDELAAQDGVREVVSLLDVPLLDSPRQTLSDLEDGIRTLLDDDVDRALARQEFLSSPLYRNLVINPDGDTTALLVFLERHEEAYDLLVRRDDLRLQRAAEGLSAEQAAELDRISTEFARLSAELQAELEEGIARARTILDRYRDRATIHLGGVPMIAADMIDFVRSDLRVFGIGVGLFIIGLLSLAFRRIRWVVVPAAICGGVALGMIGFLGFMGWPVTVVSSNFISLVLILTLSLIVHLIVRHRELHRLDPSRGQHALLRETIDTKFKPSLYSAITTMVSFGSLLFADIRPVMDFGLMMVYAVGFGFVLSFVLFPSALALLSPGRPPARQRDITARANLGFAGVVERRPGMVGLTFVLLVILGVAGMSRLSVENRFIDYFKTTTEIYQGMVLIDRELGGTTPLDVILNAPAEFLEDDDDWEDDFPFAEEDAGPTAGYWFNEFRLVEVGEIHDWLDGLPETGKVLSVATANELITFLNEGEPLDTFGLAIMYERLPDELRGVLLDPYLTPDGNQIRISIRVIDSDPDLRRDELLRRIEKGLSERFGLAPEQVRLSGMLVLYNNVMQSLFQSQFLTLFIVFGTIMLMFGFLFRSIKMAVIGPTPTLVAACMVLGVMGWLGIPLDIMTITIAAITVGIGVHDTIHYTYRYAEELGRSGDYRAAVKASHASVGQAMVYTTVIITLGFSILALSNFIPTIYFGLFTGVAMVFALLSNLTLLPLLLVVLRPFPTTALESPSRKPVDRPAG